LQGLIGLSSPIRPCHIRPEEKFREKTNQANPTGIQSSHTKPALTHRAQQVLSLSPAK